MEVVKQWSVVGVMAEEVEEDVSLQRKRFRQNSNTMETYEDGLPVQPFHPAQSFNDAEDTGSSCKSSRSGSPDFVISSIVHVDKTEKIEIENLDIQNVAVKHFDKKILPLPLIEQHVPKDSFSSGSGKQVSFTNGIIESGKVEQREEIEKEVGELYLERVYDKPGSHNFYCPNCNSCITKVIIREREVESKPTAEPGSLLANMFRCTSCFSFLIPIGKWFFPERVSPGMEDPAEQGQSTPQMSDPQDELRSKDPVFSQPAGGDIEVIDKLPKPDFEPLVLLLGPQLVGGKSTQDDKLDTTKATSIEEDFRGGSVVQTQVSIEIPPYEQEEIQSASNVKDPSSDPKVGVDIIVRKGPPEIEIQTPALAPIDAVIIEEGKKSNDPMIGNEESSAPKGQVSIPVISTGTELPAVEPSRESKRWQILKSIVYGGLAESITSLGIVTSAASADTKTVNIVVLALANLIGGLFVIGHNLRDLKNEKFKRSEGETEEQVDRYGEALGEREHIVLHFSIVILSFIVFGLIPPLVYGLSFRVSDNRDFKLAVVAAASLVCISLLALGKAHIQRPSKWQKYITVMFYYLGIGIGVSGLSYLAGDLIGKLLDKFGWFKASSEAALLLPGTSFSEPGFGSY